MSSFLDGSDHGSPSPISAAPLSHDPALSRPAIPLKLTIDQAIDRLQKGRFQRRILAAAGMCNGVNAMAVMALAFIRPAITVEYSISVERASWLSSSVFFGILAGTLVFGPLGDYLGRKPIFLLSATITAALSLASAYAPSYEALVLLRFGVGVGVGGTVIPFDTLAELTPSQFRGTAVNFSAFCFVLCGAWWFGLLCWKIHKCGVSYQLFLNPSKRSCRIVLVVLGILLDGRDECHPAHCHVRDARKGIVATFPSFVEYSRLC